MRVTQGGERIEVGLARHHGYCVVFVDERESCSSGDGTRECDENFLVMAMWRAPSKKAREGAHPLLFLAKMIAAHLGMTSGGAYCPYLLDVGCGSD